MSVSGVDFGNQSLLIGQTSKGGVDVILNMSSNRQTPTFVSVQRKQRFYGDAASAMSRSNVANTVSMVKMLVGRRFDDASVQEELARMPFRATKMAHGGVGIVVMYNDEETVISAEHFMAMLLIQAMKISEYANKNVGMADAVLAVPHWFTDAQRRGVLAAAEIAKMNCLKVADEITLTGLSYGFFKTARGVFSAEPTNMMFIDIGYSGFCVSVVGFTSDKMEVKSTVCDRHIGGRYFDDVIVDFLCDVFEKKTRVNVRNNKKSLLKLRAAAESAKKNLSPAGVTEANINVECVTNEHDLSVVLTREEFEKRIMPIVARMEHPVLQALHESNLTRNQISEVEIVGGSTRINLIKKVLGEILGLDASSMNYGLKTTMNSDESVARGGALQCAMLSSRVRVQPFGIIDRLPYGIMVDFDKHCNVGAGQSHEGECKDDVSCQGTSARLYSHGDEIPHKGRRLTFRQPTHDFKIRVRYDDLAVNSSLPQGENPVIAEYLIHLGTNGGHDVRLTFDINKHGCIFLQSAQSLQPMEEADEATGKRKFKKVDLEVETQTFGLTKAQIREAIELEASMANEDRIIIETAEKRNELESYIYSMSSRIYGPLKDFMTNSERSQFEGLLNETKDWLDYDGYDTTKQNYVRKIDALRIMGDKFEFRFAEVGLRAEAAENLKKQVQYCENFCANSSEDYQHITNEDRNVVRSAAEKTRNWLFDMLARQGDLASYEDPILTSAEITKQRNALFSTSNPIMTKPKPKPAPAPAPAPAETKENTEGESKGADDDSKMNVDE